MIALAIVLEARGITWEAWPRYFRIALAAAWLAEMVALLLAEIECLFELQHAGLTQGASTRLVNFSVAIGMGLILFAPMLAIFSEAFNPRRPSR